MSTSETDMQTRLRARLTASQAAKGARDSDELVDALTHPDDGREAALSMAATRAMDEQRAYYVCVDAEVPEAWWAGDDPDHIDTDVVWAVAPARSVDGLSPTGETRPLIERRGWRVLFRIDPLHEPT